MKQFLIYSALIMLLANCGCRAGKNQKPAIIKKIDISFTEEYCGGAAPPDVILNELAVIKPLKNKEVEVYISNDIKLKPKIFKTDSSGTIKIPGNLANTVYINLYTSLSIYKDAEKDDKQFYECYKSFLKNNLIAINLTENQNEFSITSVIKCNPCLPPAP